MKTLELRLAESRLRTILKDAGAKDKPTCEVVVAAVAPMAVAMTMVTDDWAASKWASLAPLLEGAFPAAGASAKATKACAALRAFCQGVVGAKVGKQGPEDDDEDDSLPDLCDVTFSLAYGSNILLNSARLHLKKGP